MADQLKSKPTSKNKRDATASIPVNVKTPAVRVKMPPINVDVGDPNVNIDMSALAASVQGLADQVSAMGQALASGMAAHDKRLIDITNKQTAILEALAKQKPPVVNNSPAARPDNFSVSVTKDDGTEYEMQVAANRRH